MLLTTFSRHCTSIWGIHTCTELAGIWSWVNGTLWYCSRFGWLLSCCTIDMCCWHRDFFEWSISASWISSHASMSRSGNMLSASLLTLERFIFYSFLSCCCFSHAPNNVQVYFLTYASSIFHHNFFFIVFHYCWPCNYLPLFIVLGIHSFTDINKKEIHTQIWSDPVLSKDKI